MVVRPPAGANNSIARHPRRDALHCWKFCSFSSNWRTMESSSDHGRMGVGKPWRGFRHDDVCDLTCLVLFFWLLHSFSLGFALRAVTVVSAILNSTMTESELAVKISPLLVVYLFYILSLDRQPAFLQASQLQSRH